MLSKLVRVLTTLDDLAELALFAVLRRVRARWRLLAAVLLVGGLASAYTARPAKVELPPDLKVFRIDMLEAERHSAVIRYRDLQRTVQVGDALPDRAHPELVISSIDCRSVTAVRISEGSVVRRFAPIGHAFNRPKLGAIAGDSPNRVAVMDFDRETWIAMRGTKIPATGPTKLTIVNVTANTLEYYDHDAKRRYVLAMEPETNAPPTAAELAPPADDGLDLEGI